MVSALFSFAPMGKKPFIIHDPYFHEAKRLGYRARSVFKLLEIQEKFNIIRPTDRVLDLASAPGSFLQAIAKIVKPEIPVVGIDLQKIEPFGHGNVKLLQADVNDFETIHAFIADLGISRFDVVTSDIAPATTGHTGVDQYRSVELNLAIVHIADEFLKK
jgi:23S rRNA (uridine2552-2'-O)-methyltransferase